MGKIERRIVFGILALLACAAIIGAAINPAGMREAASILTCGKPRCSCGAL